MVNEKQLRKAAAELNDVMGLDPEIPVKGNIKTVTEGIVEAISKIDPDDDFTEATQAVIDELTPKKGKGKPAPKKVKEPEPEEDEEEDDDDAEYTEPDDEEEEEEEEEPAPKKGKGKPAPKKVKEPEPEEDDEEEEEDMEDEDDEEEETPKKKRAGGPPKGVKPSFKKEGSMAEFMDRTVKAGGSWDELLATISKEAKKRGVKTSLSTIKGHAKFRVSKDPKFLGKLKITADGIE